jgi:hypothetical protein
VALEQGSSTGERVVGDRRGVRLAFLSVPFLALLGLGLSACDRATGPEAPGTATMEATWAGERWQGDAAASFFPTADTLNISATHPVGAGQTSTSAAVPLMHLRIRVPFQGEGTYGLGSEAVELIYLLGGDGVTARYTTTAAHTGVLVVEEITKERVRGSVYFEAVSRLDHRPAGQRARFEGSFDARLYSVR